MNKPLQTFRAGSIAAKIWENQTKKEANVFYTVSLERSYKDANAEWQSTNTLRAADIPKAELVLRKAYEHLVLRHSTTTLAQEVGNIPTLA